MPSTEPSNYCLPRRQWLMAGLSAALLPGMALAQADGAAPALVKRQLQFPRDLGSHPDTAIEWWYVTGQLQAQREVFGFQLTFFRSRVPVTQGMRSGFAARQLLFAHAAVTDVAGQRLLHDQRIARSSGNAAVDLAHASQTDTDVGIQNWQLQRVPSVAAAIRPVTDPAAAASSAGQPQGPPSAALSSYRARAVAQNFSLALDLQETQPLLLQGDNGWSRKGPDPTQTSFYYSLPQLAVQGELMLAGKSKPVTGRAWLDHEWSQSLMHPSAVGWDWIGMNLSDGSALTAFRLRDKAGGTLWAGGSWRAAGAAQALIFAAQQVHFSPQRVWKSPATSASYPVQWRLTFTPGNSGPLPALLAAPLTVRAVLDNQELDSTRSTGAVYWEGLSELLDSQGQRLGHGYLEMTGYARPLQL